MELLSVLKDKFKSSSLRLLKHNQKFGFDVYLLEPQKGIPYQLVFTCGVSDFTQTPTEKYDSLKHIELYFCLPEYWIVDKDHWAVEYIDKIAQIPQKNNTWFGPGDTIPTANPPNQITDELKQSYFILSEPMLLEKKLKTVQLTDKTINYFAIIPIFKTEFDYKMRNSAKVLIANMQYKKMNEMVDKYRKPVARKRILGLF
jgi:hypothetical protein